jgi:hypothetical protein
MQKIFGYFLLFQFLLTISLWAERPRVKESEIKGARKVNFYNRSNARASAKSKQEQEDTGKTLALRMEMDPEKSHNYKGVQIQRYPSTQEGILGADILFLEPNTKYGHVNSLQRMLSAYIQNSFEFSEENADTIALFTLYYNALHRNEKSYFRERFQPELQDNLDVEKTGISTNYKDWPGGTQLVLPLDYNEARGKQDIILEELVTEIERLPPKTVSNEEKKKIEEIITERKAEDEKILKIKDEKKKEEIVKLEKKAEPKTETRREPANKTETREPKTTTVRQEKREPTTTISKNRESTTLRKDQEKVAALPKREETPVPTRKEKELEVKVQELKRENETLKIKEKEKEEKSENVMGEKVLFLRLVKYEDDGHYTNELWVLDAGNEETLYKSPYSNICGKEFHVINEGVVVIGFDGNRPVERVHRLVLLDPNSLSQSKVTKEEIFWRSHIIYRDGKIYAFEKYKGEVYLSRFSPSLTLEARSSEPVGTTSELSFFKDRIFLTGKPSNEEATVIRILQREDLKIVKSLKPIENKKRK